MKRYRNFLIEYFKYSIVGICCGAIDLGVLNGLIYFFPTKQAAMLTVYNTIAYGLAVMNSYIWNSKYTFKAKKNVKQFIAFMFQALVSLLIANLVFVGGLKLFSFIPSFPNWLMTNTAKLLSMFISSTASFFFNKYFIFREKSSSDRNIREMN